MQVPAPLRGPHPALPRVLDAVAEGWAGLRPRVRTVVVLGLVGLLGAGVALRLAEIEQRWGGPPVVVLTARQHLDVGGSLEEGVLGPVRLPPDAVPPGALSPEALSALPTGAVLALALPAGSVLTSAHVDARGPAAGLGGGLRAVPVEVRPGWAVTAGGWVDVWVLGAGPDSSTLVARSRPVLQVRGDGGATTALVGLAEPEVAEVTAAMSLGGVLLTHAPPPSAGSSPG